MSEDGFSLLEVIAAIAISGAIVLGTSTLIVNSAKRENSDGRQFWIAARRMEIQGILRTTQGWNAIVAKNPSMKCFDAKTSCAGVTGVQPLVLPFDSTLLDGSKPTLGLTNKGDFCNSFDSVQGNLACPVGLQLQWQALCDDANCRHAQPKLVAKFRTKEPGKPLEDLKSFELVFFRDAKLESLNEVCTAMGGTLVGITCSIASLGSACDPGNALGGGATYPLAFDNTGAVICGKPNPGSCAAADVATGFDANGGVTCANACF